MSFDLYGTTAPRKAAKTTAQELAAAEWKLLPNGRWQLILDRRLDARTRTGSGKGWGRMTTATATAQILPFGYTKRRPCLCCKQMFTSAGAHNVVCLSCRMKNRDDWD